MKKNTKAFILTGTIGILLLFAFLFVWTSVNYQTASVNTESSKVAIVGEYSTDGENWNNMQSSYNFVNDNYETVIFKGKLSQNIPKNQYLIISMCDVWVELKANGEIVATNYYDSGVSTITPGNSISYISSDDIPDNAEIELTVSNPYTVFAGFNPIQDTLDNLTVGNKDTLYNELLKNNTPAILISLAICFLGLFAFTLAGLLWKNVRLRRNWLNFVTRLNQKAMSFCVCSVLVILMYSPLTELLFILREVAQKKFLHILSTVTEAPVQLKKLRRLCLKMNLMTLSNRHISRKLFLL